MRSVLLAMLSLSMMLSCFLVGWNRGFELGQKEGVASAVIDNSGFTIKHNNKPCHGIERCEYHVDKNPVPTN